MSQSQVQFEARPANKCFSIANRSLFEASAADQDPDKLFYHCITGITFVAFAFEAMMNHYGKIYFTDWNRHERNKNRKDRHRNLFKIIGLKDYMGKNKYQTITECIIIRDYFAHGKTEQVNTAIHLDKTSVESEITQILNLKGPEAIYSMITQEKLKKYIATLRGIQDDIEEIGKYPVGYILISGLLASGTEPIEQFPLDMSGLYTWF